MSSSPRTSRSANVDTTPILGLVAILIPLLLMAYAPQVLAVVDTNLPAVCSGCPTPSDDDPPVVPTIVLQSTGVELRQVVVPGSADATVQATPVVLLCTGQCAAPSDYPWTEVRAHLESTRQQTPSRGEIQVGAEEDVSYDLLVAAMDVARESEALGVMYPYPVVISP